jgi:hypothetical protein
MTHMTSEIHTSFPASFYAAARSENDKTSSEGLLASLGYVKMIPSINKVKFVSTQNFEKDESGKPIKVDRTNKEQLKPDQEFHSACKLVLPLMSKRDDVSIADQLKKPELYLTNKSHEFYKRHGELVDAYSKAYAISSAHAKGKTKKTKLVHVMNEVGKVARLVDKKLQYQDAEGNTYASYMELRYSYRKALEKLFNRIRSPKKRSTTEKDQDVDMVDAAKPSAKRQKKTDSTKSASKSASKEASVPKK